MFIHVLGNLSAWLTFHSLYQYAVEGSSEMQDGICTFFDNFVSGSSDITPQERINILQSGPLNKLKRDLATGRVAKLRAHFNRKPTFYS
jgi:hypothetical protein